MSFPCFQKYFKSPYRAGLVKSLTKGLAEIEQEMAMLTRREKLDRYIEARNLLCFEMCANYGTRMDALYKMSTKGEKSI